MYYRARMYDPRIGRFAQKDPEATSSNLYAYVENNPLFGTDPTGKKIRVRGGQVDTVRMLEAYFGDELAINGGVISGWGRKIGKDVSDINARRYFARKMSSDQEFELSEVWKNLGGWQGDIGAAYGEFQESHGASFWGGFSEELVDTAARVEVNPVKIVENVVEKNKARYAYNKNAGDPAWRAGLLAGFYQLGDLVGTTQTLDAWGNVDEFGRIQSGDVLTRLGKQGEGISAFAGSTLTVWGGYNSLRPQVSHFTNAAGRAGITQAGELRAPAYVTKPGAIPVGASPADIQKLLEIGPGRGTNSINFRVWRWKLKIPENGPTTSGGAWQRQLQDPTPINPKDWSP